MNIVPRFSVVPNPDTNQMIEALRRSPEMRAVLEKEAAQIAAERQEKASALTKLEAKADREMPKLRDSLTQAIAAANETERKLRDAQSRVAAAQAAVSAASHSFDVEHNELERALRSTASPEIRLFIADMREELDRTMKAPTDVHSEVVTNRITGVRHVQSTSRTKQIVGRLDAIRTAIVEAEAMQLEANQEMVGARLQQLRNDLPAI